MIVNKSMYPVQAGFSVISKMQNQFSTLQMQLGTGMKAQTLADFGRDLPISLSVRARLSTISGYNANIEQVALRLSFYDNALTRFDKLETEARNSAVQGQYGTNNINMATISSLSKARLDEVVTMLNSDVAGRYLFGGSVTDRAPLPTTSELMDGAGGRAGFNTVVTERKMADLGADGLGRLTTLVDASDPANVSVTLSEDNAHPFGFKLSTYSTIGNSVSVNADVAADPASIAFSFADPQTIQPNESVTLGFTLPDGTEAQITLRAFDGTSGTLAPGEFAIGADAAATADAFNAALQAELKRAAESELSAASTFAASQNFFNGAGEPVLRVQGPDLYNAVSLRVATKADTVMWYSGESPAVSANGMGRLTAMRTNDTVTLRENSPVSSAHGFQITGASSSSAGITVAFAAADPSSMSASFDNAGLAANDTVTLTLAEPPTGKLREVTLTAVSGRPGAGQFQIGVNAEETAANFEKALLRAVTEQAVDAEGNPRQSVSAAVEDGGRVNYGMQANESGYLRLVRSLAAMSVETYPEVSNALDPNAASLAPARQRFDAMARRQQLELSEARNTERGSIELVTMELGVARTAIAAAQSRHTNYGAQLENLLSDVETVDKEEVAMQILALQTRLQASYQATAMISQLSLVNFL